MLYQYKDDAKMTAFILNIIEQQKKEKEEAAALPLQMEEVEHRAGLDL